MRISDWSSDVCSSDLAGSAERPRRGGGGRTVSRTQCSRPSSRRLSMNIGSIKQNEGGIFVGKSETLTIAMTIALREVHSANPKAPKFEVLALSASLAWVQVGALFELFSNGTGEAFLNGKIEDPSLAAPLYISAFRQSEEHTSELQSLMRISYAVFCLKKK